MQQWYSQFHIIMDELLWPDTASTSASSPVQQQHHQRSNSATHTNPLFRQAVLNQSTKRYSSPAGKGNDYTVLNPKVRDKKKICQKESRPQNVSFPKTHALSISIQKFQNLFVCTFLVGLNKNRNTVFLKNIFLCLINFVPKKRNKKRKWSLSKKIYYVCALIFFFALYLSSLVRKVYCTICVENRTFNNILFPGLRETNKQGEATMPCPNIFFKHT